MNTASLLVGCSSSSSRGVATGGDDNYNSGG